MFKNNSYINYLYNIINIKVFMTSFSFMSTTFELKIGFLNLQTSRLRWSNLIFDIKNFDFGVENKKIGIENLDLNVENCKL